jgi:uncharacterized membrane protein
MILLHPATVHFPIALLLVGTCCTLLSLRYGRQHLETSGFLCLVIGWFTGLVTTVAGLIDAARQVVGPDAPHIAALGWVNGHAAVAIIALIVFGQALLRHRRNPALLSHPSRNRYLALLVVGSGLVVLAGWLGGHLVYTLGVGTPAR